MEILGIIFICVYEYYVGIVHLNFEKYMCENIMSNLIKYYLMKFYTWYKNNTLITVIRYSSHKDL